MSMQQFLSRLEMPYWMELWIWINIVMLIFYSCAYMLYTDGQVTIKFIDDREHFSSQIPLYINSSENISLVNLTIPSSTDFLSSLHRYYNDEIDKGHRIRLFNSILMVFVLPLYNIIYGLIIIFDGTIIKPKDLYIRLLSKYWGA